MAKIQECNKGCKKLITVQFDVEIGKYVPYEVDLSGNATQRHNCPNSMYNKQQQQGGQVTTQQQIQQPAAQQQQINTPTLETHLLNQLSQKIEELQKQLNDLKYFTENTLYAMQQERFLSIVEIVKNSNIMLDAIVAHFELTKPKKASELYNNEHEGVE